MEEHASVASLVIVIIAAFLTPILLHRLKIKVIPVVVAEILVGLIIGKSGFNLVQPDMWLETLSTLGFIFLMFLSGLEIDFSAFSNNKKNQVQTSEKTNEPNPFIISLSIFIGIFILSYGLSYLFVLVGFIDSALLMTIIISTISLGVVVPTLKEGNLLKSNIGQIILLVAVIADLVTMILLAVFVSIYDGGRGSTWLLLILFAVGVGLYFIGKRLKNLKFIESLSSGTVQIGTRAVFTLIIFLVAVSETVGAENILGAFLAGVLVSLLSPNQELVKQLDSFGYGFLIPIFFVMIGVDIDLWGLLSDPKMLMLIPLLLIALIISKIIPVYILKIWYDTKTVLASAFLLTSTLSLVVAAATIGERIGALSAEMSGTFILVAVITCMITPIIFRKLFPKVVENEKKIQVGFIGANQMTLQVYAELKSSLYEPAIYHQKQEKVGNPTSPSLFDIKEVPNYEIDTLIKQGAFDHDIVVISTGDENLNAKLSIAAKEYGVGRVICRAESADIDQKLREKEVEVFSVLLSTKALLRALIESPSMISLLTNRETSLYEIKVLNEEFDGLLVRKFPFTGDVIFVRIFRGKEAIVPHGDTELKLNDRLIVTGSKEYVDELKRELEFKRKSTRGMYF